MSSVLLLTAILIPAIFGISVILLPIGNRKVYLALSAAGVIFAAILTWVLIVNPPEGSFVLFKFVDKYAIEFKIDGLSRVFAGLISTLWPLSVIYAFEYMKHEASEKTLKEKTFFGMYTITYGVTLGIAMSANILTLYCFYEMLTLVTIPLVLFTLTRAAIMATRSYMVFSLGGAAFGFISLIFIMVYGDSINFVYGGVFNNPGIDGRENLLRLVYFMGFMGFGVKAAVFPLNSWLPKAGVAPTPVTALLHAVAVVKSGAFAIIRLTYFSYGDDILYGTWVQYVAMGFALFTILYGCTMALKERHVKRRLAYSTISNLSYILFAALIMTPAGLAAALSFMIFHGLMKITAFFCAGAFITRGERHYIYELNGIYKEMPVISALFALASLAIMGLPGLPGFIGKWLIATAAVKDGGFMELIGVGVLILSSLLTAVYMLQPVVRIYFSEKEGELKPAKDPGPWMLIPLGILAVLLPLVGLGFAPLVEFITKVAEGVI